MTPHVTLSFGGTETAFHIGSNEMFWMEHAPSIHLGGPLGGRGRTPIGPLYARLLRGRYTVDGEEVGIPAQAEWSVRDLDTVIFYGLVGGGKTEEEAADLMREHLSPMPLMQRWDLAVAILGVRFEGTPSPADDG